MRPMHRAVIVLAGLVALSEMEGMAQQDSVIRERQELMKDNQEQMRALTGMVRRQAPFSIATAQAALQQIGQNARQIPSLFLADQEPGPTAALPIVWERKDDFDARAAKLERSAVDALTRISDLEELQAAIQRIGQNCSGCHEIYRRKER